MTSKNPQELSRRDFATVAVALPIIGLSSSATASDIANQNSAAALPPRPPKAAPPISFHDKNSDAVLYIDSAATAYFVAKVAAMTNSTAAKITHLNSQVGPNDYYTAIGFLAARCIAGGQEVTDHTRHELLFGFKSALIATGIGIAAEGMSADLDRIVFDIKKTTPELHERIASIVMIASGFSPYTMTIGSSAMLGDEIRGLFPRDQKLDDNQKKAMGVIMGHVGDHSALFPGFIGDPPDIPMADYVGIAKMAELKLVYGAVPALYSMFSTILKANYFLCGQDMKRALHLTQDGMMSNLPIFAPIIAHTIENFAKSFFLQKQHARGVHFDFFPRVGEALHNGWQSFTQSNPHNKHNFSHAFHASSNIIGAFSKSMTSYAQSVLDPKAQMMEEFLLSHQVSDSDAALHENIMERVETMVSPKTSESEVHKTFESLRQFIKNSYAADKAEALISHAKGLYLVSVALHHKDSRLSSLAHLPMRMTEKARLADAFGHSQMDVMTLLPWQILLSVPISNVQGKMLQSLSDAHFSSTATTMINMMITMGVTATVDNMAAFLASSQAANKIGQPRLMQALIASIVAGSGTWAGNPIAHGQISSENSNPPYSIADSIKVLPNHTDIYGVAMAWTVMMDKLRMEEHILGKEHPIYNPKFNGGRIVTPLENIGFDYPIIARNAVQNLARHFK